MPLMPAVTVKSGYNPQSIDTSIEADVLMFQLLRQLTPQQKLQRTCAFTQSVRRLAILGIESQYPNATEAKVRQEFIKRCLGTEWIKVLSNSNNWGELVIADPIALARKIADILLPLNIPYVIGGSVASSLLGENRSTQDLDLVIDLETGTAQRLIDAMSGEFYISESAVNEAIAKSRISPRESSFNVIYLPSMEKADIFVMSSDDPFSTSVMNRRQLYPVNILEEEGIYIYSPEDIVLQKLSWYKLTPGGSQKQWRDVLGVLKVQLGLDIGYMNQWALTLKLTDLLDEALLQSGY
ncbi:MAG: hypothetical protein JGK30_32230 [Microcoleus sp. PH2017_40_RAT_O_B]|uniref:hypothetical protein n=1 Tax=unclassified Microcoleus TaxID=2642155 RepID=UPI001D599D99|nr:MULTISPECIES: hypothetical protein [unclassified Microcoleus]MCC3614009.1 hypothetical protein [Microcoleus sp. PH2017_40_RAT_O_B]